MALQGMRLLLRTSAHPNDGPPQMQPQRTRQVVQREATALGVVRPSAFAAVATWE